MTAALLPQVAPRMVDQNHSHNFRREGEEVRPIVPVGYALMAQPQIEFVNETRGL